jgi:hypothetical protein
MQQIIDSLLLPSSALLGVSTRVLLARLALRIRTPQVRLERVAVELLSSPSSASSLALGSIGLGLLDVGALFVDERLDAETSNEKRTSDISLSHASAGGEIVGKREERTR